MISVVSEMPVNLSRCGLSNPAMSRISLSLVLLAAALSACQQAPKPKPTVQWAAKLERVSGNRETAAVSRCSPVGDNCKAVAEYAAIELPGRVVTEHGVSARLRLDASTVVNLAEDSALTVPEPGSRTLKLERGHCSLAQTAGLFPLTIYVAGSLVDVPPQPALELAMQLTAPLEGRLTVHRGTATLNVNPYVTVLVQGQTALLSAGKLLDRNAGYSGRAAPVPCVHLDAAVAPPNPGVLRGFGNITARRPGNSQVVAGVRLVKHQVRTVIKDGLARTKIEEEFLNTTGLVLEGRYVFALPSGASLSRLALWVGDKLVEGEIVERKRPAQIFRGIVDDTVRSRAPALLEWVSGTELSLKLFPLEPHKSRRVVFAYNETLPSEAGTLRFRYPIALGADRSTTVDDFSLSVTAYDSRGRLHDVQSPNYPASIQPHEDGTRVEFATKGFAPSQDFVVEYQVPPGQSNTLGSGLPLNLYQPQWGKAEPELPEVAKEADGGGYFAVTLPIGMPPETAVLPRVATARVVVVDRSFGQGEQALSAQLSMARAQDLGRLAVASELRTSLPHRASARAPRLSLDDCRRRSFRALFARTTVDSGCVTSRDSCAVPRSKEA